MRLPPSTPLVVPPPTHRLGSQGAFVTASASRGHVRAFNSLVRPRARVRRHPHSTCQTDFGRGPLKGTRGILSQVLGMTRGNIGEDGNEPRPRADEVQPRASRGSPAFCQGSNHRLSCGCPHLPIEKESFRHDSLCGRPTTQRPPLPSCHFVRGSPPSISLSPIRLPVLIHGAAHLPA